MRVSDLEAKVTGEQGDAIVTGFAIDNRKVAPGTIFGAFQGSRFNGEDFIAGAIEAGAAAIVARPGLSMEGAAYLPAENPRLRCASGDLIYALETRCASWDV